MSNIFVTLNVLSSALFWSAFLGCFCFFVFCPRQVFFQLFRRQGDEVIRFFRFFRFFQQKGAVGIFRFSVLSFL